MTNTLRKVALQITIAALAVLIAVNAYVTRTNLKHIQVSTMQKVEAAITQADVLNISVDLNDMETSQRGYLLTGDPSYLQPYHDANAKLAMHFSNLRSRLNAMSSSQERSFEARLEDLALSRIEEMEQTIRLREQGYRHRAFLLVNSNAGKELMDQARTTLNALSEAQTANLARYDRELNDSVWRAHKQSVSANGILLVVTVITLLGFNIYSRRLERRSAEGLDQLQATSTRLERLTRAISGDLRVLVVKMLSDANTMLELYGAFLPRQGLEQAESIENGASHMNRVLDELFDDPTPKDVKVIEVEHPEKLTADVA